MATGTDKQILEDSTKLRTKTKGRPRINRALAHQLIKAGYSTRYIRRVLKCSARSIRGIRQDMKERGDLEATEKTLELDKIALKFDEECVRATGISFYEWLKAKRVSYKSDFSFCRKIWEQVWEKPSLVLVRDRDNPLGDQIAMKFLQVFGEDKKRLRRRKKLIRNIFRFLGRHDLCDRHLSMTLSREPEQTREIPDLTLLGFPQMLNEAIDRVEATLGHQQGTALRFKIATQMRTGAQERELLGITVGEPNGSWILMTSPDEFRGEILAKRKEKWVLQWLPLELRKELYALIQTRERGDKLFDLNIGTLRREFKNACRDAGITPLRLHDLRKVSITWLWVMGLPLEIATELNVGWKDLNTAKKYYLRMRALLKKTDRMAYRDRIPEWYKEGLEEYLPD